MAESLEAENASFWLPTHFLSDDDFYLNGFLNQKHCDSLSRFGSHPFDPLVSSSDDAFLLSLLTRKLALSSISEKPWRLPTPPQSTLTWFGRSGLTSPVAPSPPVTPEVKNEVGWELLFEAAAQVARLKMNSFSQMNNNGLITTPSHANNHNQVKWAPKSNCNCHHRYNHQARRSYGGWPSCGPQVRRMNPCGPGGVGSNTGGVKRQSVGTGVFLPRRVSNSPPRHRHHHHQLQLSDPLQKPIGVVPERVAQQLHMEPGEANINSQSRFCGNGFTTDQDIMLARRNVIVEQQSITRIGYNNFKAATAGTGPELRLPNDWTY